MIFRTITNEATGAAKSIGLFGKSASDMRSIISSIKTNGIADTFFKTPTIDKDAVFTYNRTLRNTKSAQKALAKASKRTNEDTIKFMRAANGAVIPVEKIKEAQKALGLAAKAQSAALSTLSTALNMAFMAFAAKAISWAAEKISDFVHAAEIARETSKELTDAWKNNNDSINDSIDKYTELKEKMNDASLSAAEIKDIKKELLSVQEDLVKKYGQEALGIDLVNGKYDEQISKLKTLSQQKAKEYVAQNYSNIKADRDYVYGQTSVTVDLGFGTDAITPDYHEIGFDIESYLKKYKHLGLQVLDESGYGIYGQAKIIGTGTREELYNELTSLFNDLSDYSESDKSVNNFKNKLSTTLQKSFDIDKLQTAKNNLKAYTEAEILSKDDTRKAYEDSIDAVDRYNEALASGKGIEEAKKHLDSVKESSDKTVSDISGADAVFKDIYGNINSTAEAAYKMSKAFENNNAVKAYAEQLRGLSDEDLLKIDFKDDIEQPGEDAFKALTTILEIPDNQLQTLIDKLVELGYVQGNVKDSTSGLTSSFDYLNNLYATLTQNASLLSSVNGEIAETGSMSADSLAKINEAFPENKYPEMTKALYDYRSGLIDTAQLFSELENAYNTDSQNYATLLKSESETNASFYDTLKERYPDFFENLQNLYKEDFKNWKTISDLKKGVSLNLIKKLGSAWQKYYNIFQNDDGTYGYTDTGFKVDAGSLNLSEEETRTLEAEQTAEYEAAAGKYVEKMNDLKKEIDEMLPDSHPSSWNDTPHKDTGNDNTSTDLLKEEFSKKLSILDHYHQMGYIKDEQYYRELNELNEEYLAGQEKYLDDYRSYSEKIYTGLKQSYKDMLDSQLSYMDKSVNAVTACIDNGIDALNVQKEAVENEYNTRISALENEQKALEEQQKSLEKQKEGIQEQIDAIQKANEARQKAIDLQKKQYELGRAMNQNTKQVYVNGQMVWRTDDTAVVDTGNELDSALSDAETDKLQARINALDESSKAIDSQKDTIQEQIDSLNEELDRVTEGIDRQIDALQEYRDRWSEIPSHFEEAQNSLAAVMLFGQDWQAGVLSMDESMLVNFGSVYAGVQGQIQAVTDASAMQIAQMAGLTCTSMGIMSAYTDEQLGIMSESISDNSIIGSDALAGLALSGSTSLSGLADNVGTSSQLTANALGNIITAANDAREALEKLSSLQESAGLDGIPGLHGFMTASDASAVDSQNGAVPVDITLMKRGGIAGAGQSTASRTSHGVRVPAAGLAKELGEDCLVAVKEGEGFIPPEQVDSIQSFLELLDEQSSKPDAMSQEDYWPAVTEVPDIRDFMEKMGQNVNIIPDINIPQIDLSRLTPSMSKDSLRGSVVFQKGAFNMTFNEMRDVSALGEAIVRELPNIVTRKLNPSL